MTLEHLEIGRTYTLGETLLRCTNIARETAMFDEVNEWGELIYRYITPDKPKTMIHFAILNTAQVRKLREIKPVK
jgi:hypothetical protein